MPPKKATPTLDNVYIITYQHSDTVSITHDTCEILGVYSNLEAANVAAKEKLDNLLEGLDVKATNEGMNKEGGLKAHYLDSDDNDVSFQLEVSKFDVIHSVTASKAKPAKAPANSRAKKTPTPEDEQDDEEMDDAEEAAPAAKKAAPKKAAATKPAKELPEGKPNALKGLKLLFTGTFDIKRDDCIAAAEAYGAIVIKKLEDCDYIVVAARAGQKKLDEIEEKQLETLSEQEFFEMLKTGMPEEKRAEIANRVEPEPPKKKQRK